MALIKDENFRQPLLIDVFKVNSDKSNQYDLPNWFQGHLLQTNFDYQSATNALSTLGKGHGYQHLWKEARGQSKEENAKITWFSNGKFYSMTSAVDTNDELIFARLGANDPNFNLRHDPSFIIRKKDSKNAIFVSIIEPHGAYNPVAEIAEDPFTSIEELHILYDDEHYTIIRFSNKSGKMWTLQLANKDANPTNRHNVLHGTESFDWTGAFNLKTKN
jgi:hypothetical protein